MLWRYVTALELADVSIDPVRARGMGRNYLLSSCWTALCGVVATVSVFPALAMWAVMFMVFAVPASFAQFTGQRISGHNPAGGGV